MYSRRPKAEAFSNAVDVVERLRDPTDSSTEHTTPPRSTHVQLDDVPRTLDLVEAEGEFHQHNGVVTVMMKFTGVGLRLSTTTIWPRCVIVEEGTTHG